LPLAPIARVLSVYPHEIQIPDTFLGAGVYGGSGVSADRTHLEKPRGLVLALKLSSVKPSLAAILLALSVTTGLATSRVFAQNPQEQARPQVPTSPEPLQAKTEMVKLDISVLDDDGNFVDGLTQNDFQVREDGEERPVEFFAPVSAPAKVVVVLETSPAVYLFKDEHLAAAYSLLEGLAPDDEVALVTYSDVPRSVVNFTTNKSVLLQALGGTQYTVGSAALNLYDSVSAVIDGVSRFPGKKAIVLLTTGLDSSPPARWTFLTDKLRESDVVIFAVGLAGPLDAMTNAPKKDKHRKKYADESDFDSANRAGAMPTLERAEKALSSLAAMTGGRAYFPTSNEDFAPVYREIAGCLRHEYVVGIAPDHDGHFHHLTVNVISSGNLVSRKKGKKKTKHKKGESEYRVFTRQGYVAPAS
jgi:Ca-activated chloride channel homolog